MTQWWEELFDERYYVLWERVVARRTDSDLATIGALLGALEGEVLDAACGDGRLTVPLAGTGYRMVGVDLSDHLLERARERAPRLEFRRADLRSLPRDWTGRFEVVLNWFTSFGYFETDEENAGVLREFARVLAPGGRLLLETNHRDLVVCGWQPRGWYESEWGPVLEERFYDLVEGRWGERLRYLKPDGTWDEVSFSTRAYTATELVRMARQAGFEIVGVWKDGDRTPLTLDPPARLILEARKAG